VLRVPRPFQLSSLLLGQHPSARYRNVYITALALKTKLDIPATARLPIEGLKGLAAVGRCLRILMDGRRTWTFHLVMRLVGELQESGKADICPGILFTNVRLVNILGPSIEIANLVWSNRAIRESGHLMSHEARLEEIDNIDDF
jgi:hypothetical protein